MIPILYESNKQEFLDNGLGRLKDAKSCIVEENRNGLYELSLEYPADGIHAEEIKQDRIIVAIPADGADAQPFRIYKVTQTMSGKSLTVNAAHISYDLSKYVAGAFSGTNASSTLAALKSAIVPSTCPFSIRTDITTTADFATTQPMTVRSVFGGTSGVSLIQTYGGEWEFNGFDCVLRNNRGADRGVTIRYGKNLTKYENGTEDTRYNGIIPFYMSGDDIVVGDLCKLDSYDTDPHPMVEPIDISKQWTDSDTLPTKSEVNAMGLDYIASNKATLAGMKQSISISFVALWQTEEYKDVAPLQRVHLCDTVHVIYEGIEYTAKVVTAKYNVLLNRYDELTLGNATTNLSSVLSSTIDAATADKVTTTFLEAAQKKAAQLITGGLGGRIYIRRDANGHPIELIIVQSNSDGTIPESYETAQRVWRFNSGGLGYFPSGYSDDPDASAPSVAMTSDGAINADMITTGTLQAITVKGVTIIGSTFRNEASTFYVDSGGNIHGAKITGSTVEGGSVYQTSASGAYAGPLGGTISTSASLSGGVVSGGMLSLNGIRLQYEGNDDRSHYRGMYVDGHLSCHGTFYTNKKDDNGDAVIRGDCIAEGYPGGSDRRLKQDIEDLDIEKSKTFLENLRPVSYRFKKSPDYKHHGFIAQEVQPIADDWDIVLGIKGFDPDIEGETLTINYQEIIADLVAVVQDQSKRIKALESALNR